MNPSRRSSRRFNRRWFYVAIVLLFIAVVIVGWNEALQIVGILLEAAPGFLSLAVLSHVGYYLAQNGVYQGICQAVGLPYGYLQMLPLTVAWPFINVTVPTVGLAGIALLADDARQRDLEPERGIVAGFLYLTFLYAAYGMTIWAALLYLLEHDLLQPYQVGAALAHAAGLTGIFLAIGLAGWAPGTMTGILDFLVGIGRRLARLFRRPAPRQEGSVAPIVTRCHEAVRRAVRHPKVLARALLFAAAAQGANLLCMWMVVRSLGRSLSPMQLTAVYGISYLVTLVSPSPQGIGFTEGATVNIFSSLGSSFQGAAAITLAFRGVTLWLPLLAGLLVVRQLKTFQGARLGVLQEGVPTRK